MLLDAELIAWLGLKGKQSGKGWMTNCPFHGGGDRTPCMGVNEMEDGKIVFHCFSCGESGTLVKLVMETRKASLGEALKLVGEKEATPENQKREQDALVAKIDRFPELPPDEKNAEVDFNQCFSEASLVQYQRSKIHPYLVSRGFTQETADEFKIGYDKFLNRVTIPVYSSPRKLVGIVGRTVNEASLPKYKLYNFPRGRYLFGQERVTDTGKLIVVEGMLTLIWMWQCGFRNVVALMGSEMTKQHKSFITAHADEVFLCLDNDDAGRRGTAKAEKMLDGAVRIRQMKWDRWSWANDMADVNWTKLGEGNKYKLLADLIDKKKKTFLIRRQA